MLMPPRTKIHSWGHGLAAGHCLRLVGGEDGSEGVGSVGDIVGAMREGDTAGGEHLCEEMDCKHVEGNLAFACVSGRNERINLSKLLLLSTLWMYKEQPSKTGFRWCTRYD